MKLLIQNDCLVHLRSMESNSVDAIVTDPPYGLSFMGKKWDYDVPSVEIWRECMRVLKPGGHMLVACGTRTQHRMAVNIEEACFQIRDVITWIYGSGFPKSLDVSKAIDKAAGAERGSGYVSDKMNVIFNSGKGNKLAGIDGTPGANLSDPPITDAAKQWAGWGTNLKPACEFWTLARKPLEGTVAKNVERWGTGGINVDGTRVGISESDPNPNMGSGKGHHFSFGKIELTNLNTQGRFPANLILDEEAAAMLDEQSGTLKTGELQGYTRKESKNTCMSGKNYETKFTKSTASIGGASRFFYVAKASKSERNAGCEGLERGCDHPTVKPIKLMRYLCRLITPPQGIVLDPFMGSGSTGVAAKQEGFQFIGIERDAEYFKIATSRCGHTRILKRQAK